MAEIFYLTSFSTMSQTEGYEFDDIIDDVIDDIIDDVMRNTWYATNNNVIILN